MTPLEGGRAAGAGTETSAEERAVGVDVRSLRDVAEYQSCAHLQRQIWGDGYEDVVPASMLQVCEKVGGIAAAAFLPDGEMVGFVFGILSLHEGRISHWSHMLGVLPTHRGMGVGQALKFFQRAELVNRGIHQARWTFDPLVSGNANFNLNHLGARIESYAEEVYGDTGSALHSFGTDRFIAVWDLDAPVPAYPAAPVPAAARQAPVINPFPGEPGGGEAAATPGGPPLPAHVRIGIPRDILRIARDTPDEAIAWRHSTRSAFQACLASGFRVTGFDPGSNGARASYYLTRNR